MARDKYKSCRARAKRERGAGEVWVRRRCSAEQARLRCQKGEAQCNTVDAFDFKSTLAYTVHATANCGCAEGEEAAPTPRPHPAVSDPHQVHANASGDGDGVPGRCCRLCGGDNNLRYFGDTYVWEGVEERYDQILNDCFGVKVTPSDCMICEWCVRALRTTERFRALVHAAFDKPDSELSSSLATLKSTHCLRNDVKQPTKSEKDELPKKPFQPDLMKRREERKRLLGAEAKAKRTNIPCDICKQRYPMLLNATDSFKTFVCSRCKKNGDIKGSVCRKCNIVMPVNMMAEHLDLHAKADLRGKIRGEEDKKRAPQPKKALTYEPVRTRSQRYQCSQCPKKYAMARHLAQHVRNSHGDSLDNICSVCNQDMETQEKLQEHLLEHTGLHQCDECLLIFKNKKTLTAHSSKHHADSTTS